MKQNKTRQKAIQKVIQKANTTRQKTKQNKFLFEMINIILENRSYHNERDLTRKKKCAIYRDNLSRPTRIDKKHVEFCKISPLFLAVDGDDRVYKYTTRSTRLYRIFLLNP